MNQTLHKRHHEASVVLSNDMLQRVEQRMLNLVQANDLKDCTANVAAARHIKNGGQRIRAKLALNASQRLGLNDDDAIALATCCELLHNASLVHDDLQDRDAQRRGSPTIWVAYGDEIAICTGDLLLSAAYCALTSISQADKLPAMIRLTHSRIGLAIRGQCADFKKDTDSPSTRTANTKNRQLSKTYTWNDYQKIATHKSGALLSLPLELALLCANQAHSMPIAKNAANSFAIGYQILDDLNDVDIDADRHTAAPAINIVSVLFNDGAETNLVTCTQSIHQLSIAKSHAQTLGLKHLAAVQNLCEGLPFACAELLVQLAKELQTQLTSQQTTAL